MYQYFMFKKKHFPIRNVKRLKLEKSEAANLLPPSWYLPSQS